jgi:adenine C2-methylase RlmN of 23S rRNA A2503 and tRNA A37
MGKQMNNYKIVDKYIIFSPSLLLTQCLSVTDNETDAVLLHVSASSKRQEGRNELGAMEKKTESHILIHTDAVGLPSYAFL